MDLALVKVGEGGSGYLILLLCSKSDVYDNADMGRLNSRSRSRSSVIPREEFAQTLEKANLALSERWGTLNKTKRGKKCQISK